MFRRVVFLVAGVGVQALFAKPLDAADEIFAPFLKAFYQEVVEFTFSLTSLVPEVCWQVAPPGASAEQIASNAKRVGLSAAAPEFVSNTGASLKAGAKKGTKATCLPIVQVSSQFHNSDSVGGVLNLFSAIDARHGRFCEESLLRSPREGSLDCHVSLRRLLGVMVPRRTLFYLLF